MMRIAMVSEHASPIAALGAVDAGGQNVHVANLSRALAARGAHVDVYTRRDDPALLPIVQFDRRVRVVHVDAGPPTAIEKDALLQYMREFARVLAAHWDTAPPDVAHAHFWMSGLAVVDAARARSIPTALTFHALGVEKRRQQREKDTSPPERIGLEQGLAQDVDRVLATSNAEVFELVRMGAHRDCVQVVPCGVDTTAFTPRGRRWPRRAGTARVVMVSRLVERKGIGNVIQAIADVPGAELLVAGGPPRDILAADPEACRLWRVAEEAGVADRVRLLGSVERAEVPALMRSADVVACAPWYEPFGLVALEAMACGVPVVATAVGGQMDTIAHGVTGLLVPPRAPTLLARALSDLLGDPALRRAMGRAGARRARRFEWHRVADETLAAYPTTALRAREAEVAR